MVAKKALPAPSVMPVDDTCLLGLKAKEGLEPALREVYQSLGPGLRAMVDAGFALAGADPAVGEILRQTGNLSRKFFILDRIDEAVEAAKNWIRPRKWAGSKPDAEADTLRVEGGHPFWMAPDPVANATAGKALVARGLTKDEAEYWAPTMVSKARRQSEIRLRQVETLSGGAVRKGRGISRKTSGKGVPFEAVLEAVHDALNGRRYLSENTAQSLVEWAVANNAKVSQLEGALRKEKWLGLDLLPDLQPEAPVARQQAIRTQRDMITRQRAILRTTYSWVSQQSSIDWWESQAIEKGDRFTNDGTEEVEERLSRSDEAAKAVLRLKELAHSFKRTYQAAVETFYWVNDQSLVGKKAQEGPRAVALIVSRREFMDSEAVQEVLQIAGGIESPEVTRILREAAAELQKLTGLKPVSLLGGYAEISKAVPWDRRGEILEATRKEREARKGRKKVEEAVKTADSIYKATKSTGADQALVLSYAIFRQMAGKAYDRLTSFPELLPRRAFLLTGMAEGLKDKMDNRFSELVEAGSEWVKKAKAKAKAEEKAALVKVEKGLRLLLQQQDPEGQEPDEVPALVKAEDGPSPASGLAPHSKPSLGTSGRASSLEAAPFAGWSVPCPKCQTQMNFSGTWHEKGERFVGCSCPRCGHKAKGHFRPKAS